MFELSVRFQKTPRPRAATTGASGAPAPAADGNAQQSGGVTHESARGRRSRFGRLVATAVAVGMLPLAGTAVRAQQPVASVSYGSIAEDERGVPAGRRATVPLVSKFRSRLDSIAHDRARAGAERTTGLRVVVELEARQLAVLRGADTLMVAPVAIGMDTTISYGSRQWRFETPRGQRSILKKEKDPVWVPPEWHYAEVAGKRGLKLAHLSPGRAVRLADGRQLVIRGGRVGLLTSESGFVALPTDEEIVFDGTLYVPPTGTQNRRIPGELGRFKLDMGNGYLLHGTPYEDTIGDAATHGCVRLFDEDIEWLYSNIPTGTPVFIY